MTLEDDSVILMTSDLEQRVVQSRKIDRAQPAVHIGLYGMGGRQLLIEKR